MSGVVAMCAEGCLSKDSTEFQRRMICVTVIVEMIMNIAKSYAHATAVQ